MLRSWNKRLSTWFSLMLCAQLTLSSTASFAQPKPASKTAAPAQPQDLIAKGRQLFEDQQYEDSIETLSGALLRPSNTKEQKVEIYRLLALNYITSVARTRPTTRSVASSSRSPPTAYRRTNRRASATSSRRLARSGRARVDLAS